MFKHLIYFDNEKVRDYLALLNGEKHLEIQQVKLTQDSNRDTHSTFQTQYLGKNEIVGEFINNPLLDCNEFENALEKKGANSYFNYVEKDYDNFSEIPKASIVKFEGSTIVPEEFDMMDLINQFKPLLMKSMVLQNQAEEELFQSLFQKNSTKMPLFIESDVLGNLKCFSKINSNNLVNGFEGLEDVEMDSVTILAKIISHKKANEKNPLAVFDIFKDLFSLNRSMSRALKKENGTTEIEGVPNIVLTENFVQLEILAIYQ